jgi:hypothetical protein
MATEYVGQSAYKKKGAQWITLCNAFKQCVGCHIVEAERGERINSKVNAWVRVIEKAEPGGEQGAL